VPGSTLVSTDSHANILGAIGAFGQGMGDRDIAAAWAHGSVWFRVPHSVKVILTGQRPANVSAKDIILNLLRIFGADGMLGYSLELYGDETDQLSLDERITISSMATEMGAIALFIPPSEHIAAYCRTRSYQAIHPVFASADAVYKQEIEIDISIFVPSLSVPGHPEHVIPVNEVKGKKIDSAFVGSCTNGRIEDMKVAAALLKGRRVAPGVVLKIVPSTDSIWKYCMDEGLFQIFKSAGALIGNAGCAGCASGQIGQNGPGEVTISTGNRNFTGKQGKGEVYLSSVQTAVASAIAGHITTSDDIPPFPSVFNVPASVRKDKRAGSIIGSSKPFVLEGKVWLVFQDNIDTDMIYHNRHLSVTDISQMGAFAFGNLKGWEDYASKSEKGDIIITGSNFGAGSSRQQAVDCFRSLGTQAIVARSFGPIYERNAINAGFPVITYEDIAGLDLKNRDTITIDLLKGSITNLRNMKTVKVSVFSDIQKQIYLKGDLLLL
jgi:3-isopropylmalate dehydratase small subunit